MIGKRLKLARGSAGLSLRQLAARMESIVTSQAISRYERDEIVPGSRVLIALSRALNVPVSYLIGQSEIMLEGVEFRRGRITKSKERKQVESRVLSHLDGYLELENILQIARGDWERPADAPFPVEAVEDAEVAAKSTRLHWGLGAVPIASFAECLEGRGIKVMTLQLPDGVSGLTCWVVGKENHRVPVIVVNANEKGERQRFTLARELGHMVMDVQNDIDRERAAGRFAGAMLMPRDLLFAVIGTKRRSLGLGELFHLKELFGVSIRAIVHRCRDLEIINRRTFRWLITAFKDRGWKSSPYFEPGPVKPEQSKRFRRLWMRALAENAISESKAAELLGVSVRLLDQEMESVPEA